jgi:hypothetical protein
MTTANQVMPAATGTKTAGEGSKPILLIAVASSRLAAVGYHTASRELVIKFQAGRPDQPPAIYSYEGVPPELAEGLIAAESPGGFFHRHIRQGGFPYWRHQSDDLRAVDLACQPDSNRELRTHDTASSEGPL